MLRRPLLIANLDFICRGASQLIQHDVIKPNSIHVDNILELFADEYLYISSVAFVKEVLDVGFAHF